MDPLLSSGCLCGAVRLTVPVRAVRFGFATCHCSLCRRAHGAPSVLWTGLDAGAAHLLRVELGAPDALAGYRSSGICTRSFCARCGTHTHLTYDRGDHPWAGEVHIATATFDDASVPVLEAHIAALGKPRALHVFYSDRARCLGDLAVWAAAPKYGGASGVEPLAS